MYKPNKTISLNMSPPPWMSNSYFEKNTRAIFYISDQLFGATIYQSNQLNKSFNNLRKERHEELKKIGYELVDIKSESLRL